MINTRLLTPRDPELPSGMDAIGFTPLSRGHSSHSIWGNMLHASDGHLYIAAGNHEVFGGDSWLYRLRTDDNTIEECLSVKAVIGARSGGSAVGEAKIHTRLQQAHDGWIYMATMQGGIGHLTKWSQYTHPRQYEGGHLLRYHPLTGHAESLGVIVAHEGLQTMILDAERDLLYFVTWPKKEFVRYDLRTRTTHVFGVIAWSPTTEDGVKQHYARDLFIDREGTVYCTNERGKLAVLGPGDSHITDTDFSVREGDSIRTHVQASDGTVYLCTSQGHLVRFDPEDRSVAYLGPTTPGLPVYTPNLALREEHGSLIYLAGSHGTYAEGGMQLVEFDLRTATHTVHGYMRSELNPAYCYASAATEDDVVFAVNGGEPPDSYVVHFDPASTERAAWLLPSPPKTGPGFVFGPGSEGNVPGWIVTRVHPLADASGREIPHDRCRITALCAGGHDRVTGATSADPGRGAFLFVTKAGEPEVERIVSLDDHLVSRQCVRGLVQGSDGAVYGGTIDLVHDRRSEPRYADNPFPALPDGYPGGELFRLDPESGVLSSLGTPAPGEGIYAMTVAPDGTGYALTFPTGRLIAFSTQAGGSATVVVATILPPSCPALRPDEHALATLEYMSGAVYDSRLRQVAEHRTVDPSTLPRDILLKKAYVSRAIACDADGRVYGSAPEAGLFRYDPETGRLEHLAAGLPIGMGTENGLIAEPALSATVVATDGLIYGGTVQDGNLFSLDPKSGTVRNLGKPTRQSHIRGLAEWAGDIYGLVGEEGGKCHLFRYGLSSGSLDDLGVLQGNGRRGFSVNECAAVLALDERLVIGQSERISTLHSLTAIEYEPYQSP